MSKKFKIVVTIIAALLLIAAIIVVLLNKDNAHKTDSSEISGSQISEIDIVGTWYSDKPDSVTFNKDGNYSFSEWNGGNPWLTFPGTYEVSGDTVTLQSTLDGTTVLIINKAADNGMTLSGKYTYYQTEVAAKTALAAADEKKTEDKDNIIPDTVNKLLGEWKSLDGTVTCTFTKTGITSHVIGNDILPEKSAYYEYEIVSDKKITISKDGIAVTYPYKLTDNSDGSMTLYCPALEYAPTYTKGSSEKQETTGSDSTNANSPTIVTTDRVISSEKNPDVSAYGEELNTYVKEMLIGSWRGTFDAWPTTDSIYWRYTFTPNGTYTFSDGKNTEAGTYTLTSDPNNNYYHSTLQLSYDDGKRARAIQFYFTTTDPVKMITDDQTDPTFLKQSEN